MVGRPVRFVIEDLVWDDATDAHFARHQVSQDDVMAVARSNFLGFENLSDRGGSRILVGPDGTGRILYISIRPTVTPGLWQPVTGWESRLARRLWERERGESS